MVKNTVTEAVEDLEKASNGEEVRQALIDLLDTMNTIGGDTELLAGHDQTYYVLEKELAAFEKEINMWLQYDTVPTKDSLNVMRNKDITKYFGTILENIKKINGNTKGEYDHAPEGEIGTDIQESLNALNNTIGYIKDEIRGKGVEVLDTDSVMDLATRINQIKMTTVEVVPYTATKNGEEVEEEEDPETHQIIKAYTPVTVKLELKGFSGTLTENKSYTVPEGYDGWSSVTVNVDNSGSGGSSGGGSSGGGSSSTKKGQISDDVVYNTGGADIRSNTTVRAEDYGLDAYDSATVNVTDYEMEDKTFHVTFMNNGEQLGEPVEVQMGHSCGYEGEVPAYSGEDDPSEFWYFKGWNPEPVSVVSDMTCEAEFDIWYPNSGVPISTNLNYINAPWSEIISGNTNPDYGDIKLLRLTDGTVYRMRKVNNSDDAARSVWMSMEPLAVPYPFTSEAQQNRDVWSWASEDNDTRTYFNNTVLPLMPEPVKSHIVPMNKYSISATLIGNEWIYNHMRSTDSIWAPGLYEMCFLGTKDRGDDTARNFHNDILTPVTNDFYQGSSYKHFFQWFGNSQPLKDQLEIGYNSYRGATVPDGTVMARNYRNGDHGYVHCKIPVTIPEHTDPVTGETVPEKTYNDWDSLDITTKCDFYHYHEPRFDNWLIEHAERGTSYIPWFAENIAYHGANVLLYEFVSNSVLLRDVIPTNARYGIIDENNKPIFVGMNEYGIPGIHHSTQAGTGYVYCPFCFGLG